MGPRALQREWLWAWGQRGWGTSCGWNRLGVLEEVRKRCTDFGEGKPSRVCSAALWLRGSQRGCHMNTCEREYRGPGAR